MSTFLFLSIIDVAVLLVVFFAIISIMQLTIDVEICVGYIKKVCILFFLELLIGIVGYIVLLIKYKKRTKVNQSKILSDATLVSIGGILHYSSNSTVSSAGTTMELIGLVKLRKNMGIKDTFAWLHFLVRLIAYPTLLFILMNSAKVYTNNLNKNEENYIKYVTQIFEPLGYEMSKGLGNTIYFEKNDSKIQIRYRVWEDNAKGHSYSFESDLMYNDNVEKIINDYEVWSDTELSKYKDIINDLISRYKQTGEEQMFQEIDETIECQITFRIEKPSNPTNDYKLYYSAQYYRR